MLLNELLANTALRRFHLCERHKKACKPFQSATSNKSVLFNCFSGRMTALFVVGKCYNHEPLNDRKLVFIFFFFLWTWMTQDLLFFFLLERTVLLLNCSGAFGSICKPFPPASSCRFPDSHLCCSDERKNVQIPLQFLKKCWRRWGLR